MSAVKIIKILFASIVFLWRTLVMAASPSPYYGIRSLPYISYTLGDVCYSMPDWYAHLPCNPAFIAFERPFGFYLSGFASGDLQHYRDIDNLLQDNTSRGLVRSFFEGGRSYEGHANFEVGTLYSNFGISYTPTRYYFFDSITNPALPRMTLLALKEQSFAVQFGGFTSRDWAWGIQGRGAQREYIFNEIYVTDLWAEEGMSELLATQKQSAFYIEPGLLYSPEGYSWNPTFSATLTQFGWTSSKSPLFSTRPHLHLGGGASHLTQFGDIKIGLDGHFYDDTPDFISALRMGFIYNVDSLYSSFSFGRWDYNTGIGWRTRYATLGVSYWRRHFADPLGFSKNSTEDLFFQMALGYNL